MTRARLPFQFNFIWQALRGVPSTLDPKMRSAFHILKQCDFPVALSTSNLKVPFWKGAARSLVTKSSDASYGLSQNEGMDVMCAFISVRYLKIRSVTASPILVAGAISAKDVE